MSNIDRRSFLQRTASIVPLASAGFAKGEVPVTGVADADMVPFDSLMREFIATNHVPGATLAVTRNGKLVYARGFGYADLEHKTPVRPNSLFRIASVSKPFTAVAVMQLVEREKMALNDPVLKHLKLQPHLAPKAELDSRWHKITVRHCLQHTGGWDRDKRKTGYDPIGIPHRIARALKIPPNVPPSAIVRYMMGQPLDFDPGTKYAYSNLGYLVLGRIIEAVTGAKYEAHLRKSVLSPVGISGMSLARALPQNRPSSEVHYYAANRATGECLYPPRVGQRVPLPDGAYNVEAYEAHGGWVASAPDLVRFACAFDVPAKSPLLQAQTIQTMFARPSGRPGHDADGKPLQAYYGCGWQIADLGGGKRNTWHTGYIVGENALLVRRFDGLNWAVLFNTDKNTEGKSLTGLIDSKLHKAADAVKKWPAGDLFGKVKDLR